jgi:hypothetical protein
MGSNERYRGIIIVVRNLNNFIFGQHAQARKAAEPAEECWIFNLVSISRPGFISGPACLSSVSLAEERNYFVGHVSIGVP